MRILASMFHPGGSWPYSGSERRFCALTREWSGMGFESSALEPEPIALNNLPAAYLPIRVPLSGPGLVGNLPSWIVRAVKGGMNAAKQFPFELVYATNNNLFNLIVAYTLGRRLSVPCVAVVHHLRWVDYHTSTDQPEAWKLDATRFLRFLEREGTPIGAALPRMAGAYVEQVLLRHFDGFITVSQAVADQIRQFASPKLVFAAGNGTNRGHPPARASKGEEKLAIFVGRLDEGKGTLELVQVWREVVARCPGARLSLVGNGLLRTRIANEVSRYSLGELIRLHGFLNSQEIAFLQEKSRLFITLSRTEGFGLAIAEALSAGLPVVAWDIPPLHEAFEACPAAFLCRAGDVEEVVSTVKRVLEMPPEHWRQFSQEASDYNPYPTWNEVATKERRALEKIEEAYKSSN